ncbi:MAG: carboxypeptidase regulatory-like domain-containing protein, partial [Acidobacteriota bacterium]|nr:carboxypeptidase regulatory-like domain-containing protein [Acidobacteriota bacterium]
MFITFLSRSFLCISALLIASSVTFAAGETGSVSGSVRDASGSAVSGAAISLHQIAGSALLAATSDASGHYGFSNVAAGEYLLDASAPGLNVAHSVTITLAAGDNKAVPIELTVSTVRTEVSVTAASEPQSLDQVSKALDVVSVGQAEKRGLFSVSDAVRFVPGLRVTTSGGPGALTTIQSRGLPPEDTGILIDGFRFRDSTSIKGDASAQIGDL